MIETCESCRDEQNEQWFMQCNTYSMNKFTHMRNKKCWVIPCVKAVTYVAETIRYRGTKTWELLPIDIKNANSLT